MKAETERRAFRYSMFIISPPRVSVHQFKGFTAFAATRQLGDVGGDAPGLVTGEQLRSRATSRLILGITRSFDHLVGANKQRRWNGDPECLGCLEVNDKLQFGR